MMMMAKRKRMTLGRDNGDEMLTMEYDNDNNADEEKEREMRELMTWLLYH